jgi:hypothetical protein
LFAVELFHRYFIGKVRSDNAVQQIQPFLYRLFLDYINHFSAEWQEEYAHYCEEKGLTVCEDSAAGFVRFKDEQLEAAMKYGNA